MDPLIRVYLDLCAFFSKHNQYLAALTHNWVGVSPGPAYRHKTSPTRTGPLLISASGVGDYALWLTEPAIPSAWKSCPTIRDPHSHTHEAGVKPWSTLDLLNRRLSDIESP